MNWKIEHIKSQNYVSVKTEGDFTVADNLSMTEDILSKDFWQPGLSVLFDHRMLRFDAATFDIMRQAGANHKHHDERIGDGRAAILMKSPSDYGRGRQFEMLTEDDVAAKIRIFLNKTQALIWLLS